MYSNLRDEAVALELEQEAEFRRRVAAAASNGSTLPTGRDEVQPITHVTKSTASRDDVVKVASSIPVCSDVVFPTLIASDDAALMSLIGALLRERVSAIRVLLPSASSGDHPRGATVYCRCSFRSGVVALVLLRATNLLIPSTDILSKMRDEVVILELVNRHPALMRESSQLSPVAAHPQFGALLGYDRVISVVIVKDHVESAFRPMVSQRNMDLRGRLRPNNSIAVAHSSGQQFTLGATPLAECEFHVGTNQLENDAPWNATEHRFVSLRAFDELFVADGVMSKKHEAIRDEPELWSWLFFLSQQTRVSTFSQAEFAAGLNSHVWRLWEKASVIAANDDFMQRWLAAATQEAQQQHRSAIDNEEAALMARLERLRTKVPGVA